ncbi:sigma-70 family RNA polymerase sigma factor [Actinokineospora sp. HUAS TT18]|uniref:sigma-70 family RNA polymerase sigma factor n=1 Tax=Actinokineospora sp. HUAS TT18 TaxID=3447451 RepID=UPI003F51F93A
MGEQAGFALLIERARGGDSAALEELLSTVYTRVVGWSGRRITAWEGRLATAEDVAQEVCLAVVLMMRRRELDADSFWPLVLGVVAHKVGDARRRVGRDRSEPVAFLADEIDEAGTGPEDTAIRAEDAKALTELFDVLTEPQRRLLWLRVGLGMSTTEVATELGCSDAAVRVRQHRALNRLRAHLADMLDTQPHAGTLRVAG